MQLTSAEDVALLREWLAPSRGEALVAVYRTMDSKSAGWLVCGADFSRGTVFILTADGFTLREADESTVAGWYPPTLSGGGALRQQSYEEPVGCFGQAVFPVLIVRDFVRRANRVTSVERLPDGVVSVTAEFPTGSRCSTNSVSEFPERVTLHLGPPGFVLYEKADRGEVSNVRTYEYAPTSPSGVGIVATVAGLYLESIIKWPEDAGPIADERTLRRWHQELKRRMRAEVQRIGDAQGALLPISEPLFNEKFPMIASAAPVNLGPEGSPIAAASSAPSTASGAAPSTAAPSKQVEPPNPLSKYQLPVAIVAGVLILAGAVAWKRGRG